MKSGAAKNQTPKYPFQRQEPKPTFVASFRTPRLNTYLRNAAISRRFERDPIPYALETECPLGVGGFEPLHFRIGIRQNSQRGRRDSNLCISKSSKGRNWTVSWSPQPYCIIRDAVVRIPPPQPASPSLTLIEADLPRNAAGRVAAPFTFA